MSKEHLNYLRRKTADEAELWAADRIEELERELSEPVILSEWQQLLQEREKLADRIEELERAVEFQKKAWTADLAENDALRADNARLNEQLADVTAESDELKADAVRYRWLKRYEKQNWSGFTTNMRHKEWDSAIDAAIANGEK